MRGMSAPARLRRLAADFRSQTDAALTYAAQKALSAARDAVPVRTGALRASLSLRREGKSAVLSARRPYALYVEMKKPYLRPAGKAAGLSDAVKQAYKEAKK